MRDGKGQTALHNAAENGQKFVVEFLLNRKANIEARDLDGLTALHLSSKKGHEETVRLLLDRGAIPELCLRKVEHCTIFPGRRKQTPSNCCLIDAPISRRRIMVA